MMAFLQKKQLTALLFCFICFYGRAQYMTLRCGAEEVDTVQGALLISENGTHFGSASARSNVISRNGSYAVTVSNASPYGFTLILHDGLPNETLDISVWKNGPEGKGAIGFSVNTKEALFRSQERGTGIREGNWEKMRLKVSLPANYNGEETRLYVFNTDTTPVFFDDLKITRFRSFRYPEFPELQALHIRIDTADLQKLRDIQETAFDKGLLLSTDNKWVKGSIAFGDDSFAAKLRLKGDWLDHLQGEKWSLRIKTKDGAFHGMQSFSVQNPRTRSFLDEWLFHELLREEGILTTRYGFVPVYLNGKNLGIYAWEEHFDKQIPESNNRREGPILKFEEDAFWRLLDDVKKNQTPNTWDYYVFDAAPVVPFKDGITTDDSLLYALFRSGQSLLFQHQFNLTPASHCFDTEILARYYALTDLTGAWHGLRWHNQRFYYNPLSGKLEPVSYDDFTEGGAYHWLPGPVLGRVKKDHRFNDRADFIVFRVFNDPEFSARYTSILSDYLSHNRIARFIGERSAQLQYWENLLRREYTSYRFSSAFWTDQAQSVAHILQTQDPDSCLSPPFIFSQGDPDPDTCRAHIVEGIALRAYTGKGPNSAVADIYSFHGKELHLAGAGTSRRKYTRPLPEPLVMDAYQPGRPSVSARIDLEKKEDVLFYSEAGSDTLFTADLIPWPYPDSISPMQIFQKEALRPGDLPYLHRDTSGAWHWPEGNYTLKQNLFIPAGNRIIVDAGVHLDLREDACIFSFSPVDFSGSPNRNISLTSTDGSGAVAIVTGDSCTLTDVYISGLNTVKIPGLGYTGGLTLYGATVFVRRLTIENGKGEDALNLVDAQVDLDHIYVSKTVSDGIDMDFCTGKLGNLYFANTGNDALDLSGCRVSVDSCTVTHAGDKGLSAGEQTEVRIGFLQVDSSRFGAVSKDLSNMEIEAFLFNACTYHWAAYQKKSEFGPASISVKSLWKKAGPFLLDHKSRLVFKDRTVTGTERLDVEALY